MKSGFRPAIEDPLLFLDLRFQGVRKPGMVVPAWCSWLVDIEIFNHPRPEADCIALFHRPHSPSLYGGLLSIVRAQNAELLTLKGLK